MEAKVRQEFTNPFADVETSPVTVAGEEIASKVAVRVKADDGAWSRTPAIMSADYRLLHNNIARDVGADIMSRSGMAWRNLKTMWDGRRFTDFFISENRVVELENGHKVAIGLMLRNSYDGSCVFGLELFMCNMVCTNQYHDRNRFGFYAIRHDSARKFDVQDALENLASGVERSIAFAPSINALQKKPLTTTAIIEAHKAETIPESMWGKAIGQLANEPGTMFGLLQALTFVVSHEMRGFNSITVGENVMHHFFQ